MPFKFFTVPIGDGGAAEEALNGFLRSRRILHTDRRWVEQGPASFWSFCIDYHDTAPGAAAPTGNRPAGAKPKVDYRETLPPEQFAVFAKLRDLRNRSLGDVPSWLRSACAGREPNKT